MTILTGKGRFFSAGADVSFPRGEIEEGDNVRSAYIRRLSEGNIDLSRAMSTHSKILVAAMNGPAVGLSAALIGWAGQLLRRFFCWEQERKRKKKS